MMWRCAVLLLALSAEATAPDCTYGSGLEETATCELSDLNVTIEIKAKTAQYVKMRCYGAGAASLRSGRLPQQAFGRRWEPLGSLTLSGCAPEPLGAAAARLGAGAGGARLLRLVQPDVTALRRALTPEGLRGLEALETLDFFWYNKPAADAPVLPVPTAALAALPALRNFTINGARVALTPDSFAGSPPLAYLELASARLHALPPRVFASLSHLHTLNIFRNELDNLTAEAFEGLSSLRMLSLDSNPLTSLSGALRHTPLLEELSLKSTGLRHIDNETFAGLRHLKKLEIKYGTNRELVIRARAFAALPALETLALDYSGLTALPADALDGSTALRRLRAPHNALQRLEPALFGSQARLELLDLSHNQLAELPRALLHPLKQLQELILDYNNLEVLPKGMLEGLSGVSRVSVSNNRLHSIAGALAGASDSLTHLVLSYNRLTFSDEDDTQGGAGARYYDVESGLNSLRELRHLDLASNALAAVPADLAFVMTRLRLANLTRNNFTTLSSFELNFIGNVTLDLTHNRIATLQLVAADPPPPPGAPSPPPPPLGLALLDHNPFLCDCRLHPLLQRLAGHAPRLPELALRVGRAACHAPGRLAGRRLTSLRRDELTCDVDCPYCACTRRPETKALEVQCDTLPPSLPNVTNGEAIELRLLRAPLSLKHLPDTVRELDLSGLNLTEAPSDVPASVHALDLSGNELTAPPLHLLRANRTVRLAGNPLACDCWHRRDMMALQEYIASVPDGAALRCGDAALMQLSAARLCDTAHAAVAGGVLALLGLALAVAAALLHRYSLEARVWLYARGWCRRWLPEEDLDADKTYDAFVSFSHKDADFVINDLLPRLESPPHSFKVCVHYRDWIAGEWIPAQIARSVEQSRRTIVVLSRNFLDSVWGRSEFRAAHVSAVRENRSRLVVVLLDDVSSHDEVDAELRAYLATNTYLRWGEARFWERLLYALPHRRDEARHRQKGAEVALRLPLDRLAARHVARPVKSDALVAVKVKGGLDTQINRDGKIINAAALTAPVL